jgi:hypothetical protein
VAIEATKEPLNEEKGQEGRQESPQEGQITGSTEFETKGGGGLRPSPPF